MERDRETEGSVGLVSANATGEGVAAAFYLRVAADGTRTQDLIFDPNTLASGLRVPSPFGDRWMLRVLKESHGLAVAVEDSRLLAGSRRLARTEGLFSAPEAGALVAALEQLIASGELHPQQRIVLLVTGAGIKYLECFQRSLND